MREPYYIFIAFVLGFVVAQLWKFIAGLIRRENRGKKLNFKEMVGYLTRSGGMPSGHAASMMAATTVAFLGTLDGTSVGAQYNMRLPAAGIFFVLLCVDCIVIYDAINVRRAVGEQGKALNEILKKEGKKPLRVVEGHTVGEVVVGAILGVIVGWLTVGVAAWMMLPCMWCI